MVQINRKRYLSSISTMLTNHQQIFNVSVNFLSNKSESIHLNRLNLDPSGFCTAHDEDFNQTLSFQVQSTYNLNKTTYLEIICRDDGQPILSVTDSYRCPVFVFEFNFVFSSPKVSKWIKFLPDEMTLIFKPAVSLVISLDNNDRTEDQSITEVRIFFRTFLPS